jgi:hypothetical protein
MYENDEDAGWGEELPSQGGSDRPQAPMQASPAGQVDPHDLTSFPGVTRLAKDSAPADLLSRLDSKRFQVDQIYQVDNLDAWRHWKSLLAASGGQEKWLFYACPLSSIGEVLGKGQVGPYGEFFPRLLGKEAVYFFDSAEAAARAAFGFGVEQEGYLVSCRLALGSVFKTRRGYPQAEQPPQGYDSVLAAQGTDLGDGPLDANLYAVFEPERALLRYISAISRDGRAH